MTLATGAEDLLRLMLDGRPHTRPDLIELSGLARSTVVSRIDTLLATGLVVPIGEASSTGGRPPSRFALAPQSRFLLAFDIGVRHLTVAVTDLLGTTVDITTTAHDIDAGPRAVLGKAVRQARRLLKDRPLAGIGVGLPCPVDPETSRPNLGPIMPGWDNYDVAGRLSEELGRPAYVDNDVNLMALGEHAATYPTTNNLLFIKVSAGIGSGMIIGGRLQRGAQGLAGELGHARTADGHDIVCRRCGNTGCLGTVASTVGITAALEQQGVHGDLSDLARSGHPAALTAIRQAGREIGSVLATCVNLLNPSVIVIGGSLAETGETLISGIRENIYSRSLPLATANLRVTTVSTPDTALKGAATMVLQQLLT